MHQCEHNHRDPLTLRLKTWLNATFSQDSFLTKEIFMSNKKFCILPIQKEGGSFSFRNKSADVKNSLAK